MIHRIDVRTVSHNGSSGPAGDGAADALGESIRRQIVEFGFADATEPIGAISTGRIFLIDTDAGTAAVGRIARELLADPIVEAASEWKSSPADAIKSRIEIHLKAGVMDPVAESTEMAIRDMGINVREVRTGRLYIIDGAVPRQRLEHIASRVLANGVIESVHFDAFCPAEFPAARDFDFELRHVAVCNLNDAALQRLSREGHLFLSLAEMKAIQGYFREQGREPTDVELETLAQTWSEHCVHKTLKSAVEVEVRDSDGKTVATRRYGNLIKETIFDSTMSLMRDSKGDFCLSVFVDNAGVIAFDETDAVCFKVETHNHPSAIEPYGGAATGAGGVIRDILGTGLAARPVANTDVFCVAFPDDAARDIARKSAGESSPGIRRPGAMPRGVIHPKRILQQVVAGVRDYGNRMGIPTVNGAVCFDDRYLGNPLVFCGCVGLIPRGKVEKETGPGDAIVVMGGRTGRDGIHGATFSSAELTDTHADEFSHAVQIGNAITEKKVADVILAARDHASGSLFSAVTDCGAGGLSSAIGEMGEKTGADVHLDRAPLKYAGLRYDEIWISEAQERMVLAVPPDKVDLLLKLARDEDVEATVIGTFGAGPANAPMLKLNYQGKLVGEVAMQFMHKGIPMPTRKAVVVERAGLVGRSPIQDDGTPLEPRLLAALAHPNNASKHWIIRQYDHEVQGGSAVKPLVGPRQEGPGDASVIRPKLSSHRGVVLSCGMAPHIVDPYQMAIASIDEAIRNAVAVGGDPDNLAVLDNFCWPSVDDELTMGTLVRACEACRDAAIAFGIPFISGKDSLHNQFANQETGEVIRIPSTLLISAIGVVEDVRRCVTMDLKTDRGMLCLVTPRSADPKLGDLAQTHRAMARGIAQGWVRACHDVSEGGILTAAAEMAIASNVGMNIGLRGVDHLFGERLASYIVEVDPSHSRDLYTLLEAQQTAMHVIGDVMPNPRIRIDACDEHNEPRPLLDVAVEKLRAAWLSTLDW